MRDQEINNVIKRKDGFTALLLTVASQVLNQLKTYIEFKEKPIPIKKLRALKMGITRYGSL